MGQMMWTCEKCAKQHTTEEIRIACRKAEAADRLLAIVVLVCVGLAILGIDIIYHWMAYGDVSCAFVHCRKIVP